MSLKPTGVDCSMIMSTLWIHNMSREYDWDLLSVASVVAGDDGSDEVLAEMGGSWALPPPGSGSVSRRS